MEEFLNNHPEYSRALLTFVLEYVLANKWPSNSLMGDFNDCDESCTFAQEEPCDCSCNMDPFELSDDEVRNGRTRTSLGCRLSPEATQRVF